MMSAPVEPFGQDRPPSGSSAPVRVSKTVAADVFVLSDEPQQTWTLGNARLSIRFRLTPAKVFVIDDVRNPETGHAFTPTQEPDSSVTINGTTSSPGGADWTLERVETVETSTGIRLGFTFRLTGTQVTAVRWYACYSGSPTIETWTVFRVAGSGQATLSNPSVWRFPLRASTLHYVQGLRQGNVDPNVEASFTNRSARLGSGELVLAEANRSTESYLPMVVADIGTDAFFGGLMWSGSWQISAQAMAAGTRVVAGFPRLSTTVTSASAFETPHGFFGFSDRGRPDVADALRTFIAEGIREGRSFDPLVTYNTWFAYGTEVDERTMLDEITVAARLGVELFVLDAGWYVGAGRGSNFDSGLGTWQVDPAKFPNGLAPLRDYAHRLGLRFGVWVEPERIDASTIDRPGLVREEWLAKSNGGYVADDTPQVCLASPEARQWVLDRLTRFIDEVQPDYLKWDNNFWVNCNRSGHGHGASNDGNYAHVASLYSVLAFLRARYPNMVIENCAQGGNRLDFGLLRYTDVGWMDDRSFPSAHVRHNIEGLIAFFPPAYLLSFVMSGLVERLPGAPDLPLLMRSRMPGVLGLTYRLTELTEADEDGIAAEVALYKRLRDGLRQGSGRLLTEQVAGGAPSWDAVQVRSGSSGTVTVFAFQNDAGVPSVLVQPEGLDSGATYLIRQSDGAVVGSAVGADIIDNGLTIDESPASAAHIVVLEKQAGNGLAGESLRPTGSLP